MSSGLIECVPNFSEGKNQEFIEQVSNLFKNYPNVHLLQVDPGVSTNRTVFTIVGEGESIIQAMLKACEIAYDSIDMQHHRGEHKRLGALDVCPFIPVSNVTMEECIETANRFAFLLSEKLRVPVYMYANAAKTEFRRLLSHIREGEYEQLRNRLATPEMAPDYGPTRFDPRWGASVVGAREYLIAYNVNLFCTRFQANTIAFNIREIGRPEQNEPGRLKGVQAMGWSIPEANISQVTTNILNYKETPLHKVWTEVNDDAKHMNIAVFGSEIVGVLPLDAMLAVADYFIQNENLLIMDQETKIRLVIHRLGLSYLKDFRAEDRVIEYVLRKKCNQIALDELKNSDKLGYKLFDLDGLRGLNYCNQPIETLVKSIAKREPVPGGGTVAAIIGSLGAALAVMVGNFSCGCVAYQQNESIIRKVLPQIYNAVETLMVLADQDSEAFTQYTLVCKSTNYVNESVKKTAIKIALKQCIEVPLQVATILDSLWENLYDLRQIQNMNTQSDIQVAVYAIIAAIKGALSNVAGNLKNDLEPEYITQVQNRMIRYNENIKTQLPRVLAEIIELN